MIIDKDINMYTYLTYRDIYHIFFQLLLIVVWLNYPIIGCYLITVCVNSFMYNDDLIRLSISLRDLQCMIDIILLSGLGYNW